MPTIINNNPPNEITAGDAAAWRFYSSDFLASDGWALTYALVKSGKLIEITAGADGGAHLVSLAAADTVDWPAGEYQWQGYVSKDTERYTVATGAITINANFAAAGATGMDARHHLYIIRDALQAAYESRATETQTSMSVSGRTISEMSHTEIVQAQRDNARDIMVYERKQRRKAGKHTGSTIKVRF